MTAAAVVCGSCGTVLPPNSKFCNECGAPVSAGTEHAEYKQVTVLFADVVHSMDIAATVGAERLREIMAQLVDKATAVVQRYGGTVDKFTGDGIMAVFGAPVALEDHAARACLAALGVQEETVRLAAGVKVRDRIDLQVRVGLNSGQVIAGEIGSGALGYTAVGEQVGMAQRMESVAPPGGVMLSASTARLVEGAATLGEPELVQIKGADAPVPARRLLGVPERHRAVARAESNLVGRRWEMSAVEGLLDRAIDGRGAVVGVVGPPGIGKSRLVREVAAIAGRRGVEVFTTFCESHTSQVPFHAVARLLRAALGVEGLDGQTARDRVRARVPDADPEDLLLLHDLLGIADPDVALPKIDPDARRRRLTALVNAMSLARTERAVFVIEDVHWMVIMTSNIGSHYLLDGVTPHGEIKPDARDRVMAELRGHFRPEFLNRVDDIVLFTPLSMPQIERIVELQLAELRDRLAERQIELEITADARRKIAEHGYDPVYGARPLRRYIAHEVETKIGRALLRGDIAGGGKIRVTVENGELAVGYSEPALAA